MRRTLAFSLCAALGLSLSAAAAAQPVGPGLPNLSYDSGEVLQVLSLINEDDGAPRGHGTVMMHRGYLAIVFSRDSGKGDGGFAFFDIADPRNPQLVFAKDDDVTEEIREAHGYGVTRRGDRWYVALQACKGLQFWDWTDVTAPQLVKYLELPGIECSDYTTGAWWSFWQGTYIYVGGSANGLYIVDARDPENPFLAERPAGEPNPIPVTRLGNFKTGPVFAVGDLLAITAMDETGYATLNIADPLEPRILASNDKVSGIYAGMLNGKYLYGAGTGSEATVVDITDPTRIIEVGESDDTGGRGGYLTVQDNFLHVGASNNFAKVDISDPTKPKVVGTASSGIGGRDEDFATVLGNLTVISDDHGKGSALVPHQAAPDTTPPAINHISPANTEVGVAPTARIGISFSDQIDFSTVDESTFVVREAGGAAVPGYFAYQSNLLTFAPISDLAVDTSYEIVLPDDGVKDLAGNALGETRVFSFSTGGTITNPLCDVTAPGPSLAGSEVSFDVMASGVGGTLSYQWDAGDGSARTAASSASAFAHTYAEPGHYVAIAYVLSDGNIVTSCPVPQTVHRPVTEGAPTRSSTLVFDDGTGRLYVANPDHGSVSALEPSTAARLWEAPTGGKPKSVAVAPDGTIWVANDVSSTLTVHDPETGAEQGKLSFHPGSRPQGLVFAPDYSYALVALRGTGKLAVVDPSFSLRDEIDVGADPRALAVSADGSKVFVARFLSPTEHAEVRVLDGSSFETLRTEELAYDPGPDTEASGEGVLNYLRGVTISPDGVHAWVPAKKDNTGRGLWNNQVALNHENTVRASVALLRTDGGEQMESRLDLNDRASPSAVAFSPLGDLAFVAVESSDTVEVIDAYDGRLVTSIENAGHAPDGVVLLPDGETLAVHSFLSRSVLLYDVSEVIAAGSNRVRQLGEVPTTESEVLTEEVLRGKRIFYNARDPRMSLDGYLACASCHLDGEHDGRVWDFTDRGEGLRNTTTLLGKRGTGQGKVHWSGNFDEIQDFEHDIRNAFGGEGLMSDEDFANGRDEPLGKPKAGSSADLDALAAYVESLDTVPRSPFRNSDGSLTKQGVEGLKIYNRLNCAECHGGSDFTDSPDGERHDVGTIGFDTGQRLGGEIDGIDTPTLKGIWATAPYLHNGSAATLRDVLDIAPAEHGGMDGLTDGEKDQLAAYLSQIDESSPDSVPPESDEGCSCEAPGSRSRGTNVAWLMALALLPWLRRRRR